MNVSAARKYYVPSVILTASESASRVLGSISFSAPYTSAYVTSGLRRIYKYLDNQAIAQSGLQSDFFSYPYSCVTYTYDFALPDTRTYPIDPPFGYRLTIVEGEAPSLQIGTHYGRAAIAPSSHTLVRGVWNVHSMPTDVTKVYSPTHLFPWERGYIESSTLDWMQSARVVYRRGDEVLAWAPMEYATEVYSYGLPVADTLLSLTHPNSIQ